MNRNRTRKDNLS